MRPIRIFVLQFHLDEKAFLESKERPLQARLDQAFDRPDFALSFFSRVTIFAFAPLSRPVPLDAVRSFH